jgi:hypothetical protein
MTALERERIAALTGTKLRGLVGRHLDEDLSAATLTVRAGGAGLVHDGEGWFLPVDDGSRSLGGALAWAIAQEVDRLHLLSGSAPEILARRAAPFDPAPTIWAVGDKVLQQAVPGPPAVEVIPAPTTEEFVLMLRAAEVDVVVEYGIVTGEVEGLEIARVLVDGDDGATIEIGVGRHDREAFAMLHHDRPTGEALAEVAATVRRHRRPGAPAHPLNRIAASRRLRSFLVRRPDLAGAAELVPVPPAVPRDDLRVDAPAAAVGESVDGRALVVVASVGIDLDLVPEAADVRAARAPDATLRLLLPDRDGHPLIRRQAALLAHPAEIVTVPDDWLCPTT